MSERESLPIRKHIESLEIENETLSEALGDALRENLELRERIRDLEYVTYDS